MANRRSSNFSYAEEKLMLAKIEKYGSIINSKQIDVMSSKKKNEAWQCIEDEFNANSGEHFRTAKVLRTKYENIKKRTKKAAMLVHLIGKPSPKVNLTTTKEHLQEILGIEADSLNSNDDSEILDKKRAANFSAIEEELMLDIINKYCSVIDCKKTDKTSTQQKNIAWLNVETEFNANGGPYRSAKILRTKYENVKRLSKKHAEEELSTRCFSKMEYSLVEDDVEEILGMDENPPTKWERDEDATDPTATRDCRSPTIEIRTAQQNISIYPSSGKQPAHSDKILKRKMVYEEMQIETERKKQELLDLQMRNEVAKLELMQVQKKVFADGAELIDVLIKRFS